MTLPAPKTLAERRTAVGLSRRAVAAELGVHHRTVAAWERRERDIRGGKLSLMAALYGCDVEDLIAVSGRVADKTDLGLRPWPTR